MHRSRLLRLGCRPGLLLNLLPRGGGRLLGRPRLRLWRRCPRCGGGGCRWGSLLRREDPLPDHRAIGLPVVTVLRLRLGHRLLVGYLDLLLVDLALGVDVITRLVMGPRRLSRRRSHRYY